MGIAMREKILRWGETAIAVIFAFLFLLTLVSREWIEALTGWDPDHGNGSLEWVIVAVFAIATVATGGLAWIQWRRFSARPAQT